MWRRGRPYDQGETSQCVAYTGKGLLNTVPLSGGVPYNERIRYSTEQFYAGAQRMDEWPGEDYDGTSALGLGKYLMSMGLITGYTWCFGAEEVIRHLSYNGPVGIGVDWWTAMFHPTSDGWIHPDGSKAGGHEVDLIGNDTSRQCVIGMNSWGEDWGVRGMFRLSWAHLDKLLSDGGDAVVLVR